MVGLLKPNIFFFSKDKNFDFSLLRKQAGFFVFLFFKRLAISWEKAMAPHSSTLAWKIPWTDEPGRLQSMGSQRVGHNCATSLSLFTFMHWRRKWQPTPVFLPGESQGRRSLVGCRLWGRTESDSTEATQQQQQQLYHDDDYKVNLLCTSISSPSSGQGIRRRRKCQPTTRGMWAFVAGGGVV